MVSPIMIAAALTLAAITGQADINFVPIPSYYESDGIHFPNITFRDRSGPVTYLPPAGWRTVGDAERCSLYPPKSTRADASISAMSNAGAPTALTAEKLQQYAVVARTLLPKESSNVQFLHATYNPFRICGRATGEFVFEIVISGQRRRVSCLLIPREHDIIRFVLVAPPEEFDEFRAEFHRSLYTLQGL
jgi:hypothetical protein